MRVESFLAASAVARWSGFADEIELAVQRSLSQLTGRGRNSLRTAAFEQMAKRQGELVSKGMRSVRRAFAPALDDLAMREGRWAIETISDALPNFDFQRLRPSVARRVWKEEPMVGRMFDDWFPKLTADTRDSVMLAVRQGIVNGETMPQIVERVSRGGRSALGKAKRHLETVVRTSVNHVSNTVNAEAINRASEIAGLSTSRWYATLDVTTCVVCGALDGQEWKIGEGPTPVIHPNCHCKRLPVIPGYSGGRRTSMDGPMPAGTKYEDWLRTKSFEQQVEALGRSRAELFRAGRLDGLRPSMLIGPDYRPLPVSDLLTKLERRAGA